MDQTDAQRILGDMAQAALDAATNALRIREQPDFLSKIVIKPDGSKVTPGDKEGEEIIRKKLAVTLPQAGFRGEEGTQRAVATGGKRWVVDPIDGTGNFIRGADKANNPDPGPRTWAVSVALKGPGESGLKEDEKSVLAAIFVPHPDASSQQVNGTMYMASPDMPTVATPVENGVLQSGKAYFPGAKPGNASTFSCGGFPPGRVDPTGELIAAAGSDSTEMGSFCASAINVLEGNGACLNGVNYEWDSAAAYLLLQQAGRSVIEYANGVDAKGEPQFATLAAATPTQFKALNDEYVQHTSERVLRQANMPSAQRFSSLASIVGAAR